MSTKNPSEFQVSYSAAIRGELHALIIRLLAKGYSKNDLGDRLARLDFALRTDPMDKGEPHFQQRNSRLVIHVCFERPFGVEYGIRESDRIVLVRRIYEVADPHG